MSSKITVEVQNILYKNCSEEWHAIIKLNQVICDFEQGKTIFSENDPVTGIHFILNGKIKVVASYGNKKERLLRLATDGDMLGHRGFSAKTYPIAAVALTNVRVLFLPSEIFRTLMRANPNLSLAFIDFLSEELRESENNMKILLAAEIKQRIAIILLKLEALFGYENKDSNKLSFTLSRTDMSNMAGTSYETVVRVLVSLQQKKFIKLDGKAIRILNSKGLKKLSEA